MIAKLERTLNTVIILQNKDQTQKHTQYGQKLTRNQQQQNHRHRTQSSRCLRVAPIRIFALDSAVSKLWHKHRSVSMAVMYHYSTLIFWIYVKQDHNN